VFVAEHAALHLERALEMQRRVLGDEHPDSPTTMSDLAFFYLQMGRYGEADRLFGDTLPAQRRILGADHPNTLETLYGSICLRALQGRKAEALDLLREAVANGWSDAEWAREDSDLDSLHGVPEFEAILSEIR
jgi:Flp pilus assembly protein TadD